MKKLTLSMDPKDIRAARRLADAHRTSISDLFSRLVRAMSGVATAASSDRDRRGALESLPPVTRRLSGIIAKQADRTDRELIEEAILDRHGRSR